MQFQLSKNDTCYSNAIKKLTINKPEPISNLLSMKAWSMNDPDHQQFEYTVGFSPVFNVVSVPQTI